MGGKHPGKGKSQKPNSGSVKKDKKDEPLPQIVLGKKQSSRNSLKTQNFVKNYPPLTKPKPLHFSPGEGVLVAPPDESDVTPGKPDDPNQHTTGQSEWQRLIRESLDIEASIAFGRTSARIPSSDTLILSLFLEQEMKKLHFLREGEDILFLIGQRNLNRLAFQNKLLREKKAEILDYSLYETNTKTKAIYLELRSDRKVTNEMENLKNLIILKELLERIRNTKIIVIIDFDYFASGNELDAYLDSGLLRTCLRREDTSKLNYVILEMPSERRDDNERQFSQRLINRSSSENELERKFFEDLEGKLQNPEKVCLISRRGNADKEIEIFLNAPFDSRSFVKENYYDRNRLSSVLQKKFSDKINYIEDNVFDNPARFGQINEFIKELEITSKSLRLTNIERDLSRRLTAVYSGVYQDLQKVLREIGLERLSDYNFSIERNKLRDFKIILMKSKCFENINSVGNIIHSETYTALEELFIKNYIIRLNNMLDQNWDRDDPRWESLEQNLVSLQEVFPKLKILLQKYFDRRTSNFVNLQRSAEYILAKDIDSLSSEDIIAFNKILGEIISYRSILRRDDGPGFESFSNYYNQLEERITDKLNIIFRDNTIEALKAYVRGPKDEDLRNISSNLQFLYECRLCQYIDELDCYREDVIREIRNILSNFFNEIEQLFNRKQFSSVEKKVIAYVKIRELPLVRTLRFDLDNRIVRFLTQIEDRDLNELIQKSKSCFEGESPEFLEEIWIGFNQVSTVCLLSKDEDWNSKLRDIESALVCSLDTFVIQLWRRRSEHSEIWLPAYIMSLLFSSKKIVEQGPSLMRKFLELKGELEAFFNKTIDSLKTIDMNSLKESQDLEELINSKLRKIEKARAMTDEFNFFSYDFSAQVQEADDPFTSLEHLKNEFLIGHNLLVKFESSQEFIMREVAECLEKLNIDKRIVPDKVKTFQKLLQTILLSNSKDLHAKIIQYFQNQHGIMEAKLKEYEKEINKSNFKYDAQISESNLKIYCQINPELEKLRLHCLKRTLIGRLRRKSLKEKRIVYEIFEHEEISEIIQCLNEQNSRLNNYDSDIADFINEFERLVEENQFRSFIKLKEKYASLSKRVNTGRVENLDKLLDESKFEEFFVSFRETNPLGLLNKNQENKINEIVLRLKKNLTSGNEEEKFRAFECGLPFLSNDFTSILGSSSSKLIETLESFVSDIKNFLQNEISQRKRRILRLWDDQNISESLNELYKFWVKVSALIEEREAENKLRTIENDLITSLENMSTEHIMTILSKIELIINDEKDENLKEKFKSFIKQAKKALGNMFIQKIRETKARFNSLSFRKSNTYEEFQEIFRILKDALNLKDSIELILDINQSFIFQEMREFNNGLETNLNKFLNLLGDNFKKDFNSPDIAHKISFRIFREQCSRKESLEMVKRIGNKFVEVVKKELEKFSEEFLSSNEDENFLGSYLTTVKMIEAQLKDEELARSLIDFDGICKVIKENTLIILENIQAENNGSTKLTNIFKAILIPIVEAAFSKEKKFRNSEFLKGFEETDFKEKLRKKFEEIEKTFEEIYNCLKENLEADIFNPESFSGALNQCQSWTDLNKFLLIKKATCRNYPNFQWDGLIEFEVFIENYLKNKIIKELEDQTNNKNLLFRSMESFQADASKIDDHYLKISDLLKKAKNVGDITKALSDHRFRVNDQRNISQIGKNFIDKVKLFWKDFIKAVQKILLTDPTLLKDTEVKELRNYFEHARAFLKIVSDIGALDTEEILVTYNKIRTYPENLKKKEPAINASEADIINYLVTCKKMEKLFFFLDSSAVHSIIDEYLGEIKRAKKLLTTFSLLQKEDTGLGIQIVLEHEILVAFKNLLIKRSMKYNNFETMLKKTQENKENSSFTEESIGKLEKCYNIYEKSYEKYLSEYIFGKRESVTDSLIESINRKFDPNFDLRASKIFQNDEELIPEVIAEICALWSIEKANNFFDGEEEISSESIPKPHAGQILCLFRMFGLGFAGSLPKLENNLVELKTGEGKSMILAICSIIFALRGFKVYCACYSHYLSERDKQAFINLFKKLKVDEKIDYGTFNELCEKVINEEGNLRELIQELIADESNEKDFLPYNERKVLIIDEVDVFFQSKYVSSGYSIAAPIKDTKISEMIKFIWANKQIKMQDLKKEQVYIQLKEKFEGWGKLIENSVRLMLNDANKELPNNYDIVDGKIGFYEDGNFVTNKQLRYVTAFLHIHEQKAGKITLKEMENSLFLIVNGGTFSYMEIAKQFKYILGVTGTLMELNGKQKELIEKPAYLGIKRRTFIPSVFDNVRKFDPREDFLICENERSYFESISKRIEIIIKENRAVIVFFENLTILRLFKDFIAQKGLVSEINVLTEKTETRLKDFLIENAGSKHSLILATREMGRGCL